MFTPIGVLDLPLRTESDGTIRVGKTRVTLDIVITDYQNGATPEEIVAHFDVLNLADVYVIIGYYLENRTEVDTYLERRRTEAEELRRKWEAEYPSKPLTREMLQARLDAKRKQGESS